MGRKIINYFLVGENCEVAIGNHVTEFLKRGWELYGNPYSSEDGWNYCQAMVQYEKDTTDE